MRGSTRTAKSPRASRPPHRPDGLRAHRKTRPLEKPLETRKMAFLRTMAVRPLFIHEIISHCSTGTFSPSGRNFSTSSDSDVIGASRVRLAFSLIFSTEKKPIPFPFSMRRSQVHSIRGGVCRKLARLCFNLSDIGLPRNSPELRQEVKRESSSAKSKIRRIQVLRRFSPRPRL